MSQHRFYQKKINTLKNFGDQKFLEIQLIFWFSFLEIKVKSLGIWKFMISNDFLEYEKSLFIAFN